LNIDPDIEVVTSVFSFGFIAGIGCIILMVYYFWKQRAWRFYLFFLAWFFIILSPSSSIVTLHDLAAEHRVYLALPGIIFILSHGIFYLLKNLTGITISGKSVLRIYVLLLIILSFGLLSIERNKIWSTELSLWQDTYRKSPGKIRPLINLARAHSIEGNHADAIRYYEASLLKVPGIFASNYNLGELYLKENRIEDAISRFKTALQLDPSIPETYSKLGEIYLKQKKWELADIYFKKCIEIDNRFPHVFKNLGILHFYHLKNLKESLLYFSKSLTLDPNQKDAQEIRGLISIYQRKHLNLPSQQGS
jgi:tetratricopeptide (TPR) repeat protein